MPLIVLLVAAVLLAFLVGVYNRLVGLRNRASGAWSDIDVQLKRRHDLVRTWSRRSRATPGTSVNTLEAVVQARTAAVARDERRPRPRAGGGTSHRALAPVFALAESYPELKASDELPGAAALAASIETISRMARRYYNAVVRDLNTRIQSFPDLLVARPFGFRERSFFELGDAAEAPFRAWSSNLVILALLLLCRCGQTPPARTGAGIKSRTSTPTSPSRPTPTCWCGSGSWSSSPSRATASTARFRRVPGPQRVQLTASRCRLLSVTDEEGRTHASEVSRDGRYVRIRIGDADREVTGTVVYVLRYQVRDALGRLPGTTSCTGTSTGNEWEAPILHASASIDLPAPLPADSLIPAAYVGRFGSQEPAAGINIPRPGRIEYEAGRELPPLEGLTVVVDWPHGYVRFPGTAARTAGFFADNWILLAPLAALLILWRRYRVAGRDPDPDRSVAVQYQAPPGVSPGELGTLVDEKVDLCDITATVIDPPSRLPAHRGHGVLRPPRADQEGRGRLPPAEGEDIHRPAPARTIRAGRPVRVGRPGRGFRSSRAVLQEDTRDPRSGGKPPGGGGIPGRIAEPGPRPLSPPRLLVGLVVFGIGLKWLSSRGNAGGPTAPVVAGAATFLLFPSSPVPCRGVPRAGFACGSGPWASRSTSAGWKSTASSVPRNGRCSRRSSPTPWPSAFPDPGPTGSRTSTRPRRHAGTAARAGTEGSPPATSSGASPPP